MIDVNNDALKNHVLLVQTYFAEEKELAFISNFD